MDRCDYIQSRYLRFEGSSRYTSVECDPFILFQRIIGIHRQLENIF